MKKGKQITLKSFIIIIISIIIIACIIAFAYIYARDEKNEPVNDDTEIEDVTEAAGIVSYEGTFKAKGVVVRPEADFLIIMPIESSDEYRAEEKFYYETENQLELKQEQEVEITFHYNESSEGDYTYNAIVENIEILEEKSDIGIPNDVIVKAYSSKDNISVSVDTEEIDNTKINFTITDSNEYKYNYATMEYGIYKYNPPPTSTEIIYTEEGASTPAYDPWPEITKINDISTEENYTIDENGEINISIDWTEIYGELGEGEYKLTLSTVSTPKQSIINPDILDYPYDGVIIDINFEINENSEIEYNETSIY